MTDRELLEGAARAAGLKISPIRQEMRDADGFGHVGLWIHGVSTCWNPLRDDHDALRLAVKLKLQVLTGQGPDGDITWVRPPEELDIEGPSERHGSDANAATRRAIVRAAAEIGSEQPDT